MLKEFALKKSVKLGKLLKDKRGFGVAAEMKRKDSGGLSLNPDPSSKSKGCSSVKVTKPELESSSTLM